MPVLETVQKVQKILRFFLSCLHGEQITVEYDPAEVDKYIEVADAIEDTFRGVVVEGEEVDGAFNIIAEGNRNIFLSKGDVELNMDSVLELLRKEGYE